MKICNDKSLTNKCLLMIKINDLQNWIIDYITDTIHNLECDNKEFNEWARSFERDEADFVVGMDLWELEEDIEGKTEFSEEEAVELAHPFIQKIVDHWYL